MDLSKSQLQVAFKQLRHLLTDDEEVECAAVARNASNTIYVKPCLLATDRRVIYLEPAYWGFKGKARFYNYEDISAIHIEEGWFTSKISINPLPAMGLPIVQDHLEKKRSRELVDYIQFRLGSNRPLQLDSREQKVTTSQETEDPLIAKLIQLKQLRDEGVITEAEFTAKKAAILKEL